MNLTRIKVKQIYNFCAINLRLISVSANKLRAKTEHILNEEPVKYSASPANKYKAKFSRTGSTEPRLWEENDIDQELNTSLYSRIAGLEEHQLKLSLQYNEEKGLDTEAIINRLKEIEEEKNEIGAN